MDDQIPPPAPQNPPPPFSPAVPPLPPVPPPPIISVPPAGRSGSSTVWKILALVFLVLLCLSLITRFVNISHAIVPGGRGASADHGRNLEEVMLRQTNSDNKIAVITVDGVITSQADAEHSSLTLADFIAEQLKEAEHDSDVKAVILKVDSPGGEVMAADDIHTEIKEFQERSHKPVIVSMGALAASGGYYISAPCRWIVANELTLTGSIGVIMDTYNYRLLMDKVGIRPHVFKSGRFKDMLSGEREPDMDKLSPEDQKTRQEEDQMVQSLITETYDKFKSVVKDGRSQAAAENDGKGRELVDNWQDYADGRVLSGKRALELGFVDELGNFDVAVQRAEKLANISSASLVEYQVVFDVSSVLSHLFGKSETPAIKVDFGLGMFGLPQLEAGRPYYILPTAVLH